MLTPEDSRQLESIPLKDDPARRKQFIERMERKLAYKAALQRQRRNEFRSRLGRLRAWQ